MYYCRRFKGYGERFRAALIILFGIVVVAVFLIALQGRQSQANILSSFPITGRAESSYSIGSEGFSSRSVQGIQASTTMPPSLSQNMEDAPDFELKTLDGDTIQLSDFAGQPVIINFWASWCAPCRIEMPALVRAYETYQDDGLALLAVNGLFQDDIDAVRDFVDEFGLPFPVLLDDDGSVHELYRVLGIPMSYFVTRSGGIQARYLGGMTDEEIIQAAGNLMTSPAPHPQS